MIRFTIILALILVPFCSQGQGLAGKTISIAPHISLGPNLGRLSRGGNPDDFYLQTSFDLDIEKTLNRGSAIGIYASYSGVNIEPEYNSRIMEGNLTGQGLGIFYKKYLVGNGAIAPIGSWFKFTYARHWYKAESSDPDFFYQIKGVPSWSARLAWGAHWRFAGSVLLLMALEIKAEVFPAEFANTARVETIYNYSVYQVQGSYANLKLGLVFPLF